MTVRREIAEPRRERRIKGVGSLCLVKLSLAFVGGHVLMPLRELRYQVRQFLDLGERNNLRREDELEP